VTETTTTIPSAKAALRLRMRVELSRISSDERQAVSARARELLKAQPCWRQSRSILFYAPRADEPDLWPLVAEAIAEGKLAALPRFTAGGNNYSAARVLNPGTDLRTGKFGIREPNDSCAEVSLNRLDLILVPGLAFDLDGRRLGRGKGYYDVMLGVDRGLCCGVAFDQQIVGELPTESHDVRLSCILTPTRWHVVSGPRADLK
jgi:5-formyltetrahydrofolate cyclo-ligase